MLEKKNKILSQFNFDQKKGMTKKIILIDMVWRKKTLNLIRIGSFFPNAGWETSTKYQIFTLCLLQPNETGKCSHQPM